MTAITQQFGIKAESTFGTAVTVDRFYEVSGETLRLDMARVRSAGRRASQRVHRSDRFMPYKKGVSGSFTLDVPTKGFGVLLNMITGGTASVGSLVDSNYAQTHTLGTHLGKMFTAQMNKPHTDATDKAFTFEGCKVTQAVFACDVDGVLTCEVTIVGEDLNTTDALASVSYTASRVFAWKDAAMTVAGSATEVRDWRTTITIPYNTDERYFLRSSALMKQPLENDLVTVMTEFTIDHANLTQYDRFRSATSAGALAALATTFTGDVLTGATTYPSIVFTVPAGDFEEVDGPNVQQNAMLTQRYRVLALDNGTDAPLTVTYTATDSAI